jgi:transposase
MYKSDARKLGKESQQLLRNQAINLLKRNVPCKKIAKTIGVHPSTIYMWLNLYKKLGEKELVFKKTRCETWYKF